MDIEDSQFLDETISNLFKEKSFSLMPEITLATIRIFRKHNINLFIDYKPLPQHYTKNTPGHSCIISKQNNNLDAIIYILENATTVFAKFIISYHIGELFIYLNNYKETGNWDFNLKDNNNEKLCLEFAIKINSHYNKKSYYSDISSLKNNNYIKIEESINNLENLTKEIKNMSTEEVKKIANFFEF